MSQRSSRDILFSSSFERSSCLQSCLSSCLQSCLPPPRSFNPCRSERKGERGRGRGENSEPVPASFQMAASESVDEIGLSGSELFGLRFVGGQEKSQDMEGC
ncbi:hypothetical protein Q8A67_004593 [Cirrhinus molitorella]|uniref:Uncharacterized protein n=1 Tax=Cirrhinus molitorella TaxID=172907 RepID=A0AA88Q8G7_9TELE|nr:hypothetical protein Q8A67_004593 [Cirrhinus molitorella]